VLSRSSWINIRIDGSNLADLAGLEGLREAGWVILHNNTNLNDISALHNVTEMTWLQIMNNPRQAWRV
jgi:hypothetical protein